MTLLLFRTHSTGPATPPVEAPTPAPESFEIPVRWELSLPDPMDAPVWLDESTFLRGFSLDRGKNDELDQVKAGTATVRADGRDGRYDPWNASSPHSPDVVPMRRTRLSATVSTGINAFTMRLSHVGSSDTMRGGGVTYPLYTGFVESWAQTRDRSGNDVDVQLPCVDGLAQFAISDFDYDPFDPDIIPTGPPYVPDELTGTRVSRLLDDFGWSEDDRQVDAGTVTILGSDINIGGAGVNIFVHENALSYLHSVVTTEAGQMFVDASGRFRFIDADGSPPLDTSVVFGGIAGEVGYQDIDLEPKDVRTVYNRVEVSSAFPTGTATSTATDTDSIEANWERKRSFSILASDKLTTDRADELLDQYKDPVDRITALVFRPKTKAAWRHIVGHELADVVRVRTRTDYGVIQQDSRIEGISITSNSKFDWRITWRLSAI